MIGSGRAGICSIEGKDSGDCEGDENFVGPGS